MRSVQRIAKHFKKVNVSYEALIAAQEASIREKKAKLNSKISNIRIQLKECKSDTEEEKKLKADLEKKLSALKEEAVPINRMRGLQFKLNVVTRWSSALEMLKRATLLRNFADTILLANDDSAVRSLQLPESTWKVVAEIIKLLQPFADMTTLLSGSKNPTSSFVLPSFKTLLKKTKKAAEVMQTDIAKNMARDLYASLTYRWKHNVTRDAWYLAAALDPRFKSLRFLSRASRDDLKEALKQKVKEALLIERQKTQPQKKTTAKGNNNSIFDFGSSDSEEAKSGEEGNMEEDEKDSITVEMAEREANAIVSAYMNEPDLAQDMNPLEFWTSKGLKYGVLADIACKYLTLQASSVASERLFSSTGVFVTKRTASMKDSTLSALVFLRELMRNEKLWAAVKKVCIDVLCQDSA